jgi:hypothetical protein
MLCWLCWEWAEDFDPTWDVDVAWRAAKGLQ